jgi:putative transcriptional regulator
MSMARTRTAAPKARRAKPKTTRAGRMIIAGLEEAAAYMRGEHVPGLVVHKPLDVAAIRRKSGLSQPEFAKRFGLSVGTLRDWEQGRKAPERTAQILLRVIEREPAAVERALRERV